MTLVDTINVMHVRLCMLVELYLFMQLKVTWVIFQGHNNVSFY